MGSDKHYPEERPIHRVTVDGFWMDPYPVTNDRFARFVEETGHTTFAESLPKAEDYPGALPEILYAGSLVFASRMGRVDRGTRSGGIGRAPTGASPAARAAPSTGSSKHPVVHVAFTDAEALRRWEARRCRRRPSGSSQRAADWTAPSMRGATSSCPTGSTWPTPGKASFRGRTCRATDTNGRRRSGAFPPNGYGVYDMIGNTWEWTTDWYHPEHPPRRSRHAASPRIRAGRALEDSFDPRDGRSGSPARSSRGDRTCARRTTAGATAGRPLPRADRHLDVSRRLPVHRAAVTQTLVGTGRG